MRWEEVCYEILDYESKLLQIKASTFHSDVFTPFERPVSQTLEPK